MQQTKLLALLFAFACVHVHAQEVTKSSLLYKQLHIKSAEGYVYEAREDTLPFLLTVENFNVAGNRTKIDIYDTSGIRSTYAYIFEQDTIYTERRTSFRNKLSSVTKVYRDEKGNIVKYEELDTTGNKIGWYSTMRYNKKQQVIEEKTFIYKKLISHKKIKYHPDGKVKETRILRPKNRLGGGYLVPHFIHVNTGENSKYTKQEEIENYKGYPGKMIRTSIIFYAKNYYLGVKGFIDLKMYDRVVTERYYQPNGLLDFEEQFLNGKFIGKKAYKYLYY